MDHTTELPLIVGAGPVGLAAAVFLAQRGERARIVEMRAHATDESKALAVNPRTLELLAPTGVTERMLALGLPITEAWLHVAGRLVEKLSFADVHALYPFMLAFAQSLVACGAQATRSTEADARSDHRHGSRLAGSLRSPMRKQPSASAVKRRR